MFRKSIFLIVCNLLILASNVAQIPVGYYDNANNKTGEELKAALYNIIKGHVEYPYTSTSTDTWDILKQSDKDTLNPDNVLMIYSGISKNAALEYDNANGWTREHVWAKSRGDFGTDKGAGTDCHHLRPAANYSNTIRNNRFFATSGTSLLESGVPTGSFYSTSPYTFEPRDIDKGDVARMIFYMAVRYEGENGEPDLELTDLVLPSTDKSPLMGRISELLKWHYSDPVSKFERNRNEVVFQFQNNRNPFIDHPEYVEQIWPSIPLRDKEIQAVNITFYNSSNQTLIVEYSDLIDVVRIYDILGKEIASKVKVNSKITSFDNLNRGIYVITLNNSKSYKVVCN